jgi:membrane associated rhomboid family serine protease
MGRRGPPQLDLGQVMPLTPFARILLFVNVGIWFVGTVILEQYFLGKPYLTIYLGLSPYDLLRHFFIWQPFTYLFIHAVNPMHIIFNMLLLWWLGGQLERLWGSKFFALFYFVSGVGAAFLYSLAAIIYSLISGQAEILVTPVIGASSALFGLLVAYGVLFGEQTVFFMFIFPMKAKYFVALLAGIEIVLVLNNGPVQGKVANLAHVGGLVTGYIFLKIWPKIKGGGSGSAGRFGRSGKSRNKKLRLVVNNDEEIAVDDKPKYWN